MTYYHGHKEKIAQGGTKIDTGSPNFVGPPSLFQAHAVK